MSRDYRRKVVDMSDYPKHIKRLLREYAAKAYERELHRELVQLDQAFAEWRAGAISSSELSQRIHQYETGPSRELFKRYNHGELALNVAYAVVTGILNESEVAAELLEAIQRPLDFYRRLKEEGDLRMPGE